jgi:hypothetical protein
LTLVAARCLLIGMTHREFLLWLQPRLERASATGLGSDGVREVLEELGKMSQSGALQPFASRLHNLLREQSTLDANIVAGLVSEVRAELVPAREKTVVLSAPPGSDDD